MKKASTNLHLGLPIRGRYQSLKSCILSGKVNRSSFGEEKIVESTTLPTHFPEFRIAQKVNDWVPHGGRLGEKPRYTNGFITHRQCIRCHLMYSVNSVRSPGQQKKGCNEQILKSFNLNSF